MYYLVYFFVSEIGRQILVLSMFKAERAQCLGLSPKTTKVRSLGDKKVASAPLPRDKLGISIILNYLTLLTV